MLGSCNELGAIAVFQKILCKTGITSFLCGKIYQ
jgi:hypothetical protein